jgi:hypothetical protein
MEVQQVSMKKVLVELDVASGVSRPGAVDIVQTALKDAGDSAWVQGVRLVEETAVSADAWPDWLVLSGRPGEWLYVHGPFWSEEAAVDFAAVFGPDTPWRVKQCEAGLDKQWRHR